jgi:hypothetical protein
VETTRGSPRARPATVANIRYGTRCFIEWLTRAHPAVGSFAEATREQVLVYAASLDQAASSRTRRPLSIESRLTRLSDLAVFFHNTIAVIDESAPNQAPIARAHCAASDQNSFGKNPKNTSRWRRGHPKILKGASPIRIFGHPSTHPDSLMGAIMQSSTLACVSLSSRVCSQQLGIGDRSLSQVDVHAWVYETWGTE